MELLLDDVAIRGDRVVLVDVDTHTEVRLSFEDAIVLLDFLEDNRQEIEALYDAEARRYTKVSPRSPTL
jgi:hypothetical protein